MPASTLRISHAEAAALAASYDFKPLEQFPGSNAKWRCKCIRCGTETLVSYRAMKHQGVRGCRTCWAGYVDPADAQRLAEALDLRPLEPYVDAKTPWRCECLRCGSTVGPVYRAMKYGIRSCKVCRSSQISIPAEEAHAAMLRHDLQPLEPYPGSNEKWRCKCLRCNSEVAPIYTQVVSDRQCRSCRTCTDTRPFDAEKPAIVYLLHNPKLKALKVGVAMQTSRRVEVHAARGWEVVRVHSTRRGARARAIEATVLRRWRNLGAGPAVKPEKMPQGGWTETVALKNISLHRAKLHFKAAVKTRKAA